MASKMGGGNPTPKEWHFANDWRLIWLQIAITYLSYSMILDTTFA